MFALKPGQLLALLRGAAKPDVWRSINHIELGACLRVASYRALEPPDNISTQILDKICIEYCVLKKSKKHTKEG